MICKENAEAIREAQGHGGIVAISSSRSFLDTNEILQKANLVFIKKDGRGLLLNNSSVDYPK